MPLPGQQMVPRIKNISEDAIHGVNQIGFGAVIARHVDEAQPSEALTIVS